MAPGAKSRAISAAEPRSGRLSRDSRSRPPASEARPQSAHVGPPTPTSAVMAGHEGRRQGTAISNRREAKARYPWENSKRICCFEHSSIFDARGLQNMELNSDTESCCLSDGGVVEMLFQGHGLPCETKPVAASVFLLPEYCTRTMAVLALHTIHAFRKTMT